MDNDKLMEARWRISGIQKICNALQTSEAYEEDTQNLFFILSQELFQVMKLMQEESQ